MSTGFASADYTAGQLNAMVKLLKKQAGEDGPERFLRGELTVSQPTRVWREQDGVIYFSVTSDGTSGEAWIARLWSKGFGGGDCTKSVLRSPDFKPTSGITTKMAVLKATLFNDDDRITKNIRAEAGCRNWTAPNAETACLIREMFSDEDIEAMGLWWIVVMHKPINVPGGGPHFLGANRDGGGRWLGAFYNYPGVDWDCRGGFAFAVSSTSH